MVKNMGRDRDGPVSTGVESPDQELVVGQEVTLRLRHHWYVRGSVTKIIPSDPHDRLYDIEATCHHTMRAYRSELSLDAELPEPDGVTRRLLRWRAYAQGLPVVVPEARVSRLASDASSIESDPEWEAALAQARALAQAGRLGPPNVARIDLLQQAVNAGLGKPGNFITRHLRKAQVAELRQRWAEFAVFMNLVNRPP